MEKYVNIEPLPPAIVFEDQVKVSSPSNPIKAYSTIHKRNNNITVRKSVENIKSQYVGDEEEETDS